MKKRWDDIKQGWKVYASVLLVAIFILILNRLTPYVADDYTYMYSFADGKKMTSIGQIFSSLWEHYMSVNGRIIPHFFVHLFVMNSKIIFDIVNTLFFIFSMICENEFF